MTNRIESPQLVATWVSVNRGVLVELMEWAGGNAHCLNDTELELWLDQLQQAVEQGRIDVLTKERWEGTE